MMQNTEGLNRYIQRLYEAVFQPEVIGNIVDDLRTEVDAPYSAFQVENQFTHELKSSCLIDYDESSIDSYARYYITRDPWTRIALERGLLDTAFIAGQRYLSDKDYQKSEFYSDWGRHHGVRHAIGSSFDANDGYMVKVCFQRHCDQQAFDESVEHWLNQLHPHFKQFVRLSALFQEQQSHQGCLPTLDYLGRPVWIVDRSLKIIYSNQQAQDWMSQPSSVLANAAGYLLTPDHQQQQGLQRRVRFCSELLNLQSTPTSNEHCRQLGLGAPGEEEHFWLMPLPASTLHTRGLVMVTGRSPLPSLDVLMAYHGLTRRQAQVCQLLMQGVAPHDAAQHLNVSVNTVRNLLYACFQRLQVGSQSELIQTLSCSLRSC